MRQRKVVQWSLAYAAVAWALLQVFGFAVDTFHWPEAAKQVAAILTALGLPVTVTLAWFHGDRGHQRVTRAELALLAALLALGVVGVSHVAREPPASPDARITATGVAPTSAKADRHRVAVLPFANLGGDPANVAFAGGVHDTLITQVAKIPGLSVISRSSVLQFADKQPTIKEVALALGVGAVLEGSVERDGNRLRIQAQLIDADTDAHLWAETYDRTADDLFAVQSEIAQRVAEQLRIHLASNDTQRLVARLTSKPEAYEHYVLGRNFVSQGEWPGAIHEFTTAVTIDPDFAAAHAQLSLSRTWLAFNHPETRAANVALAKAAAEKALALDPTLPEAHLALAIYLYRGQPDIERAAAEFERAVAGLPNDAVAFWNFGNLRRWQGRWDDAEALYGRAAELDPRGMAVEPHILALVSLGRRDEASRAIVAAIAVQPDNAEIAMLPGGLAQNFSCDLATNERVVRRVAARFPQSPEVLHELWFSALQIGDGQAAVDAAERMAKLPGPPDDSLPWRRGLAYRLAGRRADAERSFRDSLQLYLSQIRAVPAGDVRSDALAWAAMLYAMVGDKRHAIAYADRALAALPPSGDAANRTDTEYFSAIALAWAGEPASAVERMRQVLDSPGWPKPAFVWCDPLLAPLRGDARFRKVLAERGADLSIDPYRRETWPKPTS